MKRQIYEVYAKVVDANGSYNTLSGYPKVFDSHQNNDDCDKALSKAYGEYHSVLGTMYARFDRQCQFAMIIRANDGLQIEKTCIGKIADLPDPKYEVVVNDGAGSGSFSEGEIVNIRANPAPEGKIFEQWEGASELNFVRGDTVSDYASFTMPNNNVEVTATYVDYPETEQQA